MIDFNEILNPTNVDFLIKCLKNCVEILAIILSISILKNHKSNMEEQFKWQRFCAISILVIKLTIYILNKDAFMNLNLEEKLNSLMSILRSLSSGFTFTLSIYTLICTLINAEAFDLEFMKIWQWILSGNVLCLEVILFFTTNTF